MISDFHLHSTASDGRLEPEVLVRALVDRRVAWAALTDHDTTAGWERAAAEASRAGLELTCGAELSVECNGDPVHLLALGIDPEHASFAEWLAEYRLDRIARALAMLDRLDAAGVPVDRSVIPDPGRDGVIARPHIADAVVAAGGAADTAEVFERYLADDAPCHVPLPPRPARDAIRRMQSAGGIAVIAHPGDWTSHRTLLALVSLGLDGIEIGHPTHGETLMAYYSGQADALGLVVTGGSDFHGRSDGEFERLGAFGLPEPRLDLLRERLRAARHPSR